MLLRQQTSQMSPADWQRLNATAAALVAAQSSSGIRLELGKPVSPMIGHIAIDTATPSDFEHLPGIGQARAKALTRGQATHGYAGI